MDQLGFVENELRDFVRYSWGHLGDFYLRSTEGENLTWIAADKFDKHRLEVVFVDQTYFQLTLFNLQDNSVIFVKEITTIDANEFERGLNEVSKIITQNNSENETE